MSDLDPRVVFYLERQKQIDEWYALRKEVTKAANRFFKSLADDFAVATADLEGDPKVWHRPDANWPKLFLYRDAWFNEERKRPRAAIGLERPGKSVLFDNAYAGVWVAQGKMMPSKEELEKRLRQLCEPMRNEYGLRAEKWLPAWKYMKPPAGPYWNNLDEFRHQIIRCIEDYWRAFYPIVDKAIAEIPSDA